MKNYLFFAAFMIAATNVMAQDAAKPALVYMTAQQRLSISS